MSSPVATIDRRSYKHRLSAVLALMADLPQVPMPLKHHFAPGVYIREIFMPKGTLVIGKIHKTEHFNIIQQGRVELIAEGGTMILEAPITFISKAGVQKTLRILEDTVWSTVHLTDLRDLEALETALIEPDPSYPALDRTEERLSIERAADAERVQSVLALENQP